LVLVFAAVGVSGSGKTTTLEYLISRLTKEGYKVGAIKHIHREKFTIDKEGTNTYRLSKAGSIVTVAISPEEIAIIKKTTSALNSLNEIICMLEKEQLDIVFIEGFHSAISKRADIIKVVTAKNNEGLMKTLEETVQPILAITGLVAKNKSKSDEKGIPVIDLPQEGEQLVGIVKKQLKKETKIS
jgi:molybdopterin-guanine dinucleotide biosynthesis protein B